MHNMHLKAPIEETSRRFKPQQATTNYRRFLCVSTVFNYLLTVVHRAKDESALFEFTALI